MCHLIKYSKYDINFINYLNKRALAHRVGYFGSQAKSKIELFSPFLLFPLVVIDKAFDF